MQPKVTAKSQVRALVTLVPCLPWVYNKDMNTTKNTAPPAQPARLGKIWKDYITPGVYEPVQAVTADGEWLIERMEDATWFVGHLPTQTEVKGQFKSLRAARVYIARGDARTDYDAITAEQAEQQATPEEPETPAANDIVTLAHVADAITEVTGDDDYDAVAEQAAHLLNRVPSLAAEVARYGAFAIEWDHLLVIVQAAMQVPAEPRIHAEAGADFPACGWIQEGETVTGDPAAVTCRFCKDTVNANRIVAELALQRPPF
jgi:hypothetical protein